jgi:hypothetical protein
MTRKEQLIKALEFFKDWSNYLLVTTVAATGWVAAKDAPIAEWARPFCIWAFGLSAVLGIVTLAIIPRVAECISDDSKSIYDVSPTFNLAWMWRPTVPISLKVVCWPQHVLFIIGIVLYVVAIPCR